MISYPDIDPIIFSLGPFALRWYSLAYIVGIGGGFHLFKSDFRKLGLNNDDVINLMTILMLGVILGGRIGYVFFYDLGYYLENPANIAAIWNGGMSFHGGAIGAMLGFLIFANKKQLSPWGLLDILGIGSTIGIFLGRIANFINGELYGRVTDVPWGMVFPSGGPLPRHPSQLYEALLEGLFLFLFLLILKRRFRLKSGQLFAVYLITYAACRFVVEFFREPDVQIGFVFLNFSMGQVLSAIMVLVGSFLLKFTKKI